MAKVRKKGNRRQQEWESLVSCKDTTSQRGTYEGNSCLFSTNVSSCFLDLFLMNTQGKISSTREGTHEMIQCYCSFLSILSPLFSIFAQTIRKSHMVKGEDKRDKKCHLVCSIRLPVFGEHHTRGKCQVESVKSTQLTQTYAVT